jgi:hypothetical protein
LTVAPSVHTPPTTVSWHWVVVVFWLNTRVNAQNACVPRLSATPPFVDWTVNAELAVGGPHVTVPLDDNERTN